MSAPLRMAMIAPIVPIVLCAMTLHGCGAIGGVLPTLQYCHEVRYERNGNQIKVEARCQAPIGG